MVPCLEVPGSQEIAVDGLGCLGCDSVLSCRVVALSACCYSTLIACRAGFDGLI